MKSSLWQLAVVLALTVAAAGATAARAQTSSRLPLIAILEPGPGARPAPVLASMKEALAQLGWVEGRTARFETRYGNWQADRMAEMARELVGLKPDVFYTHSTPGVRAATQATTSLPIVVGVSGDLVATAGIKSLAKPGGNVTGMTLAMPELDRKRLEILREAVPLAARIAYLLAPGTTPEASIRALDDSARHLGVRLHRVSVRAPAELEPAFGDIVKVQAQAIFVSDAALFAANVDQIAALALKHRLPAMSQMPRFAESGGLFQYGADVLDLGRRSAGHVDKILRGAKPGDLPIEQPTKVDLIVNLKTATALGITIPRPLLIRADRVIE